MNLSSPPCPRGHRRIARLLARSAIDGRVMPWRARAASVGRRSPLVIAIRPRAIVVAMLLCACGGCRDGSIAAAGIGAGIAADGDCREQVADLLHFGLDTPDGTLADAEWERFVDTEITPRFPAGLTALEAHGQWRGRDGRIEREPSRVVEIVHADDTHSRDALRALIDLYKSRYRQESVLRVRSRALACF